MSTHVSADEENAGFDSPPPPSGTTCWICFEDDGRLLRNCACRGDSSGYAHVSCLAKHAQTVSDEAEDFDIVRKAWAICPNCKQQYNGDVSLLMAEAFVEYASRLPNDMSSDLIRFDAQALLGDELFETGKNADSRNIFQRLLDSLQPPDTKVKKFQEAYVVERLANSYVVAGESELATNESKMSECIGKAFSYYEKAHRINVELYGEESEKVLNLQNMLAKFRGDTDASIRTARALYSLAKAEHGSDSAHAFAAAVRLRHDLQGDNKHQEALELMEETFVKARRVLGPEHPDTLDFEKDLKEIAGAAAAKTRKRCGNSDRDNDGPSNSKQKR